MKTKNRQWFTAAICSVFPPTEGNIIHQQFHLLPYNPGVHNPGFLALTETTDVLGCGSPQEALDTPLFSFKQYHSAPVPAGMERYRVQIALQHCRFFICSAGGVLLKIALLVNKILHH